MKSHRTPADGGGTPERAGDARRLEMLDGLFDGVLVGFGLFDTRLRYLRVNDVLRRFIGLPEADLVGRTIAEVLPGFGDEVLSHLRRVLETGTSVRDLELWRDMPGDEHRRCFSCSYFRLHGAGGEPLGVASVVLDVTKRRQAEEAVAAVTQRLTLLTRAGELLGSTLDTDGTLAALAELTVPAFADHCTVDLVDTTEPGSPAGPAFRRMALVHSEQVPAGGEAWRGTSGRVTYPADHAVARAVRDGAAVLVDDAGDEQLVRTAPTAESAAFARKVGLRSAVVVPLIAHGTVLGALSFATSVSGRRYDADDLELAKEIAGRTAVALDNAQRYERERVVALALQHSLLPRRLADHEALATESVYLPGGSDTAVGGDWFDVIPLGGGRTGVVIGDVMGRGVHAAAVMGQLRAAVRSSAVLDLSPGALLHHLDDIVQALDDVQIVTCVYGVYDPAGTITLANAGHLPPLLLDADGCRPLDLPTGPPLGVGQPAYPEQTMALAQGAALVLYTDGLVERRSSDIDAGIGQLCAALSDAPRDAALCATALSAMGVPAERDAGARAEPPGAHDDDIAVLVIRPQPADERTTGIELRMVPSLAAPRDARRALESTLRAWQLDARLDSALLVVSELVTNAVRHARTEVTLRVRVSSGRLVIEVGDHDARLPQRVPLTVHREGGRGLHLVAALAHRWGVRPSARGKVVWVEL